MGTDELKTEINEVVWRYDCIHDDLRIFCKRWPYRKEFSKRTIRLYMSKINKIIPKIFDLRTFNPIEGDVRSVEEILISMMNDEANSNADVRVIRSALGHAISELMFEIIYDLRDNHFPIKNEQALETFTHSVDQLDRMFKWLTALYEIKFEIKNEQKKRKTHRPLILDDRIKIMKHIIKNKCSYWAAAAALFLTGCSPEDVRRGVHVNRDRECIIFSIDYTKRGDGMKRGIGIYVGDPFYDLAEALAADYVRVDLGGEDLWRTSEVARVVSEIGLAAGLDGALAPVSFRHAFGRDLYAMGYSQEAIAQTLGYKSGAAEISFARSKRGFKGRRVRIGWFDPMVKWVLHDEPTLR